MPLKTPPRQNKSGIDMCTYALELFRQKHRMSAKEAARIFSQYNVYDFMLRFGHLEQTYTDNEILQNVEQVIIKNKSREDA